MKRMSMPKIATQIATQIAALALLGACSPSSAPPGPAPAKEPAAMTSASSPVSNAALEPLVARLGQLVTVEGVAQDAKLGAMLLIGGSRTIWIDSLDAWPPEARGKRVRVTGKLIERSDLPVFVQREGEPATPTRRLVTRSTSSAKMRPSAVSTSGLVAARPRSSYGRLNTHCRTGALGKMASVTLAATSHMRRVPQLGHRPRCLQEKATRMSWRQASQWQRTNPREKSPHAR